MHIVIDARIIESSTGVYVQRLIHFLYQIDQRNNYTILAPERTISQWREKYPRFTWIISEQKSYTFSEQLSFAWQLYRLRADLVHFTMPQQPLLYLRPSVTTIHDTTLVRFNNIDMNPLVYSIRKTVFSFLLRVVAWRSRAVLVPTEFVKQDLQNYLGAKNTNKFIVTLEAGDPVEAEPEVIPFLDDKDYICFVGNAFPYKNIMRIVEAFAVLKQTYPNLHLALGGKKDYFYKQIEDYIVKNNVKDVHILGFISHGEKRWLYQHATAMVTASLSEGFCIPLLEAMYEQCPVVSSNVSCLPEVAGDAALYFDPNSTADLVRTLTRLFEDPTLRQTHIEKGNRRVKDFSWQRMAEQTIIAYQQSLKTK